MTRRQLIALTVTVVALAAAVTAAWLADAGAQAQQEPLDYEIAIERDGAMLRGFTIEELKSFETRSVTMQGQLQEGPMLLAVLESAGVRDFDRLVMRGQGVRDDGLLELSRAEVDQDVLLDFAIRGTVKVCGPSIEWEDRVRDIERIEVF